MGCAETNAGEIAFRRFRRCRYSRIFRCAQLAIPPRLLLSVLDFLIVALLWSDGASSQTGRLRFEHLSMREGLSNFTVLSIIQDRQGFLWFGTEDGLNRYDGTRFTVYRHVAGDSASLPANMIPRVCARKDGGVWIGTPGGLAVMDPGSRVPKKVSVRWAGSGDLASFQVWRLMEDRDGRLWIGTEEGVLLFDPGSGQATRAPLPDSVRVPITAMTQSADGSVWVGSWGHGIFRFTRDGQGISLLPLPPSFQKGLTETHIPVMLADSRNWLWIGTTEGLVCYDSQGEMLRRLSGSPEKPGSFPLDFIDDILEDHSGTIWIGTFHSGLARFDESGETFSLITNDPGDRWSLPNNRVVSIYEDQGGILWVSTYRGGLSKHNPALQAFVHFTSIGKAGEGLPEDQVYSILEDSQGDVWFGLGSRGLARYRKQTRQYRLYSGDRNREGTIANGFVPALFERKDGDLWVGTGAGIDLLQKKTGRITHVRLPSVVPGVPASYPAVKTIVEDEDGIVWFGTMEHGLYRLDPSAGSVRNYRHDPQDSTSLGGNGVFSLCLARNGEFWVGSLGGGLNRLDRATGRFTRYRHDDRDPTGSLSGDGIYHVVEDEQGFLWIGTFGGGLNRFDPRTGSCRHWDHEDGLPNNFVKSIIPDERGMLWLSTDYGLSRFDPTAETFQNFTIEDGLAADVFLSGARWKGREGMLYFGGEGGVTAFRPQDIRRNAHIPPIQITDVSVSDVPYPLLAGEGMTLSHDQNTIAFGFVALDFAAPARNTYRWMVEGIDRDWISGGTQRFVRYTQILPGSYTFRVRGANADGLWNERGATWAFTIDPPMWETWWFRLLVLALLGTAGTVVYRYRVNRLLEIERLRVRIASDLHDDIGASLSRIALQSELMTEGIEPDALPRYLKNIASTSRELVTTMSDIVWSIDARNDSVEHLMTRIRDFAMSTLEAAHIGLRFSSDGLGMRNTISVERRENLYLICKEAINNIAKHSGASQASIEFRNSRESLTVTIADNGRGWRHAEPSSGHGLRNMRMRAERLGGTLQIEQHEGTRVVLEVPPV